MKAGDNFFNFYNHDFVRVAVGIPAVRVADPAFNAAQTIALMREGAERRAMVVLFPELGLTAYSCDDLFQQRAVLDAAEDALRTILDASRTLNLVAVVGMPVRADNSLFNCAVAISRGRILAAIPKTYPPNYREFYELRQFAPAASALSTEIDLAGQIRRAVRHADPAALRRAAVARDARGDLRGPVDADRAVGACGARGRDRDAESFRVEHHRQQGRLPPRAGREPIRAMHRRISLLRGRTR